MTDFEKFKKFLDSMGIKYISEFDYRDERCIDIDSSHMDEDMYDPYLSIIFNNDENFRCFSPSGE